MKSQLDISAKVYQYIAREEFTNRHGVHFEAEDDYTLSAKKSIITVAEKAELYIELFGKKKIFSAILEIKTIRDLHAIDMHTLRNLYDSGKAQLVCKVTLDYTYFLVFRILHGQLIIENDFLAKHQASVEFKNPMDFINYTINYYTLLEACDN